MNKATSWWVVSVAALAAALVSAAEPAVARADWPLWDGKESVADYAKRAGIKDVQKELDLGDGVMMKVTLIPAGKFVMGAGAPQASEARTVNGAKVVVREADKGWRPGFETPIEVTISQPFYMGVYEVTQEQHEQVMGSDLSKFKGKNLPVDGMWHKDAVLFCDKLAAKTGLNVSLPTEAQWEYACRAGTSTRFHFGDDPAELYKFANYADRSSWRTPGEFTCTKPGMQDKSEPGWDIDDGFERTAPVGSFKPNNWELYDMHGNVREWVSDWAGGYCKSGTVDPTGPAKGDFRANRGGGWWSPPSHCNAYGANAGHGPGGVLGGWGCRVVVALKDVP